MSIGDSGSCRLERCDCDSWIPKGFVDCFCKRCPPSHRTVADKGVAVTKDMMNTINTLTYNHSNSAFSSHYNASQLKIQHQKIYPKQQTKPK